MRTLLFTLDFPPLGGGISRYNEGLARFWPEGELAVLAPEAGGSREVDDALPCRVFRRRFFTRIPTPSPALGIPRAFQAAREVIAAYRPELLLCAQPLTTGFVGETLSGSRPVVVFAHGEELRRHRASFVRRMCLRHVLSRAARVVVVSEYGRREAAWFGVDSARVLKTTGILPEHFDGERGTLSPQLEAQIGRRPCLLSVGRLETRKGQDVVIDALSKLPGGPASPLLVLVGEGERRRHLEARSRELGVADRVIFAGRVDEGLLRALYRRADLFVLAARPGEAGEEEGLGLVFIEAAAAGTPSVATRVGGISEAVVDGQTGVLVSPEASGELAGAIARLLADGEGLARLGANARERARREYDWRVNVPRLRNTLAGELAVS